MSQLTVVAQCYIKNINIQVVLGSALDYPADALVNAANERLEHGGGIAAEIANKGGSQVWEESKEWIKQNGLIKSGGVAVTTAGKMNFKCVIHAVGPKNENNSENRDMLVNTIYVGIKEAASIGCKSIVFPGISCGIFGFPKDVSAKCHFDAFCIFCFQSDSSCLVNLIAVCLFNVEECQIFFDEFVRQSDKFDISKFYGLPYDRALSFNYSYCNICHKSSNILQNFIITANCCNGICDFCVLQRRPSDCYQCNIPINQNFFDYDKCQSCFSLFQKGTYCSCNQNNSFS